MESGGVCICGGIANVLGTVGSKAEVALQIMRKWLSVRLLVTLEGKSFRT